MLNVYITVDTEIWPRTPGWRESALAEDIRRDILGVTPWGDFGVPFHMEVLDRHGLKAVFLVESLFASVVGLGPLRDLAGSILDRGHEVQLHVHTEWLPWMRRHLLPSGRNGQFMREFTEDEQAILIAEGLRNLREAGVREVCAFRAGHYGANFDTLRALARNGIRFDTSHNTCYLDAACGLRTPEPVLQPRWIDGVYEVPVSFYEDWPSHFRHAQICAVSSREMENTLLAAWERGWTSFVIVSHGFEMLKERKQTARPVRPDPIVIKRFERLCQFLGRNSDKFRTLGFADTVPAELPQPAKPLKSGLRHTAWRFTEQLARRVL